MSVRFSYLINKKIMNVVEREFDGWREVMGEGGPIVPHLSI